MKRVYINEQSCIGCGLCDVYCRVAHSDSKDLIKTFKKGLPRPLPRLSIDSNGPVSFSVRCQHCDDAPCVYSCLTGALSRDPDSNIVTVDEERCVGCWTCVLACPFGAIKQDTSQYRIVKCDLCPMEETLACVGNCPNEALVCEDIKDEVLTK